MEAVVKQLWTYPLKSGGGIPLSEANLTPHGIELDRKYMLVGSRDRYLSQRQLPKMALLRLELDGNSIVISYPGKKSLAITPDTEISSEPFVCTMHKKGKSLEKIQVVQVGGKAASDWFNDVLDPGRKGPIKLVQRDPNFVRAVETDFIDQAAETNLADGYPYLIVEDSDFLLVNSYLKDNNQPPLTTKRVRGNIVTDGFRPWEIMHNGRLTSDTGVELDLVKPSKRCQIIMTNQRTGEIDIDGSVLSETLPTINRALIKQEIRAFGQNAILLGEETKTLAVGDRVSFDAKLS